MEFSHSARAELDTEFRSFDSVTCSFWISEHELVRGTVGINTQRESVGFFPKSVNDCWEGNGRTFGTLIPTFFGKVYIFFLLYLKSKLTYINTSKYYYKNMTGKKNTKYWVAFLWWEIIGNYWESSNNC